MRYSSYINLSKKESKYSIGDRVYFNFNCIREGFGVIRGHRSDGRLSIHKIQWVDGKRNTAEYDFSIAVEEEDIIRKV